MVQKHFRAQFACAASIAVWILQHRPDLATRSRLRILVACATDFEALDSGRWLQFIPWLLGRPTLQVEASIVGAVYPVGDGVPEHRLRTHAWTLVKDRAAAVLVEGTIGDWRRSAACVPDLCAIFSPEFARGHAALLSEEGVLPLLREGVPLALFSATEAEQLVDLYTLRAFGLSPVDPECWPNPWALEPVGAAEGAYAGMGWAGEFTAVAGRLESDASRLQALGAALEYVRELLDAAGDDAFLTLGEGLRAAALDDASSEAASVLLRLPHAVAVDTANGHVYQILETSACLLGSVPPLPAAALQTFPGHEDLVARAIWAIAMHREHVQPHVIALDQELRAELAGA